MSNLLKGYWVSVNDDATKVVDSNELADRKILEEQERMARLNLIMDTVDESEGFFEGLPAEKLSVLVDEDAESAVMKVAHQEELEKVNAEVEAAKSEIESIRIEAARMLEDAHYEAEQIKSQAFLDAQAEGYEDGRQRGLAEVEAMKADLEVQAAKLQEDYENAVNQLEPMIVDKITDIYEHIFNVNLSEYKTLVASLIIDALNNSDGARNIIIHVAKEDYQNVIDLKGEILTQTGTVEHDVEFIQDGAMKEGSCLVETENGVFDCSIDVYLSELKRKLRIISYKC